MPRFWQRLQGRSLPEISISIDEYSRIEEFQCHTAFQLRLYARVTSSDCSFRRPIWTAAAFERSCLVIDLVSYQQIPC